MALAKVRPRAAGQDVDTMVQVGWALRVGLGPFLRGLLWSARLRGAARPLFIGRNVRVFYGRQLSTGRGVFLGDNVRVNAFSRAGVQLGDRVTIRENGWIQCASSPGNPGEGLEVESDVYIGPGVIIGVGGAIHIGQDCQLGSGVTLIAENHSSKPTADEQIQVTRSGIRLGRGCWLGHRVTILDGVTLGDRCTVGAGAVVTKSFPAGSTIAGVPARLLE